MIKDFYVICDNIRSLENIGSIFRTSDALGVNKIYLCGISGKPPRWGFPASQGNLATLHHKISKTALGAEQTVSWEYVKQIGRLIDKLKERKISIVALEQAQGAVEYTKFKPKFPLALILGNEVKGISEKILNKCDKIIYLPMSGQKESLNVSVAFGVAGYQINTKKL
jgi:tRNA G18 (ribose-2'-O)-methylase SpoU